VDVTATWQFWAGNHLGSDSGTAGDSIDLTLSTTSTATSCDVIAKVQRDDHGFNLCLVTDPDQTCSDKELLRKTAAQPR
jgi:hypothetical protein